MIYGPRKTEELARRALAIRAETGRTWKSIAAELGVSLDWVRRHTVKFGRVPERAKVAVATPANIERAKALRTAGKSWKAIARDMGLADWSWLRHRVMRP